MEANGFIYHSVYNVDMFLDGPESKPSEAVHIIFAGEKVKTSDLQPTPSVQESDREGSFTVISLEALVGMKLTSFRRKDQTHLEDMVSVGLISRVRVGGL